jgi:hypothetical protein
MKKFPIHPFLIAFFPVFTLWASNLNYITPDKVIRSFGVILVLSVLLLAVLRVLTRDWVKAGVITSITLLIFFTYGHLYNTLADLPSMLFLARHRYLLPAAGALWVIFIFVFLKFDRILPSAALFLTVMGLLLLAFPVVKVALFQINAFTARSVPLQMDTVKATAADGKSPDIYYVILDGYGREDALKKYYGYDNSAFIKALEDRGFFVADASNANYMETLESLSSSLNMDYLDGFIARNGERISARFLTDLIAHSRLRQVLSDQGYQMISFQSSFENISDADVFLAPSESGDPLMQSILSLNEFESMLIDASIGKVWLDSYIARNKTSLLSLKVPYLKHRNRILFAFSELGQVAKRPGRKFVFAHVVAPHPPFVFDRNGNAVKIQKPFSLVDANYFRGTPEEYIQGYTEQIQYVNSLTLKAIDEILANSAEPPIIVIQGDHGPRAHIKFGSLEESNVKETMPMLNAYYFPDQNYSNLYPSISPVNSFRVILDQFLKTNYGLLPDIPYFSTSLDFALDESWTSKFTDVSEELKK